MTPNERKTVEELLRAGETRFAAMNRMQRTPYGEHGQRGERWKAAADNLTQAEARWELALAQAKALCHRAYADELEAEVRKEEASA